MDHDPLITELLELASRRLIIRILVVPVLKCTTISLITAINQGGDFSLLNVNYEFFEKSHGKILEKYQIFHIIDAKPKDLLIIQTMENILNRWDSISSSWRSKKERILETATDDSAKEINIKSRHEYFNELVHEFLSRAHSHVHCDTLQASTQRLSGIVGVLDHRLGALLAENRPW